MSESDSRSLDIQDAEFAEKTVTTLGKVRLSDMWAEEIEKRKKVEKI